MMVGFGASAALELIVAALLCVTIGYCVIVNRKLNQLKSDKDAFRAIVAELAAATSQAQRAIGELRGTVDQSSTDLQRLIGQAADGRTALVQQLAEMDQAQARLADATRAAHIAIRQLSAEPPAANMPQRSGQRSRGAASEAPPKPETRGRGAVEADDVSAELFGKPRAGLSGRGR